MHCSLLLARWLLVLGIITTSSRSTAESPFLTSELLFPLEHWHNHASCIVEAANGDLLVCWFHGSGERRADDVVVEGARLRRGSKQWGPRAVWADTPGYPDTNCALFIDPQGRLWLLWPTILANEWHTALMKYKISSDYLANRPPRWQTTEVLHVTPGNSFIEGTARFASEFRASMKASAWPENDQKEAERFLAYVENQANDKLKRRLGWMTRAHPFVLDASRLIVPLYSDGFSFSLMAITDDWGATWHTSTPLCGAGNIQPSIAQRKDGSLYTLMRDNGPAPHRLMQSESRDRGETWSRVTDSTIPNPGSGAEITTLRNGEWALICNDTEKGRHRLVVMISEDEGVSWRWKRALEEEPSSDKAGSYHYPSLIQAKDGSLHASYSYFVNTEGIAPAKDGTVPHKSIKHAHFNEAWVKASELRHF